MCQPLKGPLPEVVRLRNQPCRRPFNEARARCVFTVHQCGRGCLRNHFHSPIYDVVEFAISLRTHNSWQELVDERIEHHTRIVCRLIIGWPKVMFLAVSAAAREDSETFHNNGIPVPGVDTSGAEGIRTPGLLIANETRYQLRHSPLLGQVSRDYSFTARA